MEVCAEGLVLRCWMRSDLPRSRFHCASLQAQQSATLANAVEGFFSKLARQRLKHAVFNSLDECVAAVEGCIAHHNANEARPFSWSRKPEEVVESWKRGYRKLQESA